MDSLCNELEEKLSVQLKVGAHNFALILEFGGWGACIIGCLLMIIGFSF